MSSPTWTTCSSEPVFSHSSTAASAARDASSEPSIASTTFVGKMLIPENPLGSVSHAHHPQQPPSEALAPLGLQLFPELLLIHPVPLSEVDGSIIEVAASPKSG